jgi:rhodanese-related sulfurtransferase
MNEKIREIRFDSEKAKCFFSEILAFTISPVELKSLLEDGNVKVVDVREAQDYDIAHIPSAISIPLNVLQEHLDKLSKEETTVVYCYNRECSWGAKACLKLAQYGYPVVLLKGGYKTWTEDFRFSTVS